MLRIDEYRICASPLCLTCGSPHGCVSCPKMAIDFRHRRCCNEKQPRTIAVGTAVTSRPPHRSVHAEFPHTAPTLGVTAKLRLQLSVCAPAPVTWLPGSVPGP